MRNRWRKYILSLAMVICGAYTGGMLQGVFAQETAQPKEVSGSEMEDLKWQLKQMEESMQRQQEQIQALKKRLEQPPAALPAAPVVSKEEIKQVLEDYLSTDEARKKMALGLPNL